MTSTDEGMQIDESDSHSRNADRSIREILQGPASSIDSGMTKSVSRPKYSRIETQAKSNTKFPQTRKCELPSAIESEIRSVSWKANRPNSTSPAGKTIDESDEQCSNANFSIRHSLESGSNVTVERVEQRTKQDLQITSTDEGMQINESHEHRRNADSPIRETLHPSSNTTLETIPQRAKQPKPTDSIQFGIITSLCSPK
jgi:hypothetical protein